MTPYLINLKVPTNLIGIFTSGALIFQSLGSFLSGKVPNPKNLFLTELYATLVIGILLLIMGLAPLPWIIFIVYSHILLILPFLNIWNRQIWFSEVPHEFQGRAFALRRSITSSLALLGAVFSGPFLDFLSTKFSNIKIYQIGFSLAGVCLLTASFLAFKISKQKRINA